MKATALCTLLLATVTFVSGEGGAISVMNNVPTPATFFVEYRWEGGNSSQEIWIPSGETKTAAIPKNITYVVAAVLFKRPSGIKRLYAVVSSKPVKGCLNTYGTVDDPKVDQIALASVSRSVTIFNNGTFLAKLGTSYRWDENRNATETITATNDGDMSTIMIPEGTTDAKANVYYYPVDLAVHTPGLYENATELFDTNLAGHECYKLWGDHLHPQYAKIDCQGLISHNVSTCKL